MRISELLNPEGRKVGLTGGTAVAYAQNASLAIPEKATPVF